eukprot:g48122.t1
MFELATAILQSCDPMHGQLFVDIAQAAKKTGFPQESIQWAIDHHAELGCRGKGAHGPPEESTCEAEIYATLMDAALHGQEKIANFINGIAHGKVAKDLSAQGWGKPPVIYEDNKGAIKLANTNIL